MYSQFGEDSIIKTILGDKVDFFVDIGAYDGVKFSNTKFFKDNWSEGLSFDARDRGNPDVIQEFFTVENINEIFAKYDVPDKFDLLSLDVDGNDYWLWKALRYEPKVVVIEYDPKQKPGYIHDYNAKFLFEHGTHVFDGSSKESLISLAEEKGYGLVSQTQANLIFKKI